MVFKQKGRNVNYGQNSRGWKVLFFGFELILAYAADRTGPIIRKILEGDVIVFSRIIDVAANRTDIFFHQIFSVEASVSGRGEYAASICSLLANDTVPFANS